MRTTPFTLHRVFINTILTQHWESRMKALSIEQNVSIFGDNLVTLDGEGADKWTSAFTVTHGGADVSIEGMVIKNFKNGIQVTTDAACLDIRDVSIESCETGLFLVESYQADINLDGSVIAECQTGIKVETGSSHNAIRNGTVWGSLGDGILVEGSIENPDNNIFKKMNIFDNRGAGIAFMGGFDNQIVGSIISGNNISEQRWAGVAIFNGSGAVKQCTLSGNHCTGVYADEVSGLEISNNLITGAMENGAPVGAGIRLSFTQNVTIMSNTVTENGDGLLIEPGSSPTVLYNIIYGNGVDLNTLYDPLTEQEPADLDYARIQYNDIGTTAANMRWLPSSNVSLDPEFLTDYTLDVTSPCIDATDADHAGIDLSGQLRPLGSSWDMGAIETVPGDDTDRDGLPDWWEEKFFRSIYGDDYLSVDPDGDHDGDGKSNFEEYLEESSPVSILSVRIDSPQTNPYYHDVNNEGESLVISGISEHAESVEVSVNGNPRDPIMVVGDAWADTLTGLVEGQDYLITVTASAVSHLPVQTSVLVVTGDDDAPVVVITLPTEVGAYTTALSTINIRGLASDDTQVASVSWRKAGGDSVPASGTTNWTAADIPLELGLNHVIITATDNFLNTGTAEIVITKVEENTTHSGDIQTGLQPTGDPLDPDEDGYMTDDEIACGSDPGEGDPNVEGALPNNPNNNAYPFGHPKYGYLWPACLNPDNDSEGLPDEWEERYTSELCLLDPYIADTDGDGSTDDLEDCDADGFTNIEEYENGTDPMVPQYKAFEVTVRDIANDNDISDIWLPEYKKISQA